LKNMTTNGSRFIDAQGRQVILHGISMVCKDKEKGYLDHWTDKDFLKLKQWGFNVIRLGIIWDGIEPQPGQFDGQYIENVRGMIRMADRYGLYVFLDMHQDLYSSLYADGAPAWATLIDDHVYVKTELWSDAYLFDRAVQTAFDHFWSNTPASDGIGLQDHYVAAWRFVAERLRDEPNLIGYDMMNEPFIGSKVEEMVGGMFTAYGELVAEQTGRPPEMEELLDIWTDHEKKLQALEMLNSVDAYRYVMQATAPAQDVFEKNVLSPFFQKIGYAIREVDPDRILFLETNYFSNLGVASSIQPIKDAQGRRDPQQAYAPHGYDLVTDSDFVHAADSRRIDFIFDNHVQTRDRLDMPMLIGEWGAYGESRLAEQACLDVQKNFERMLCGDVYWCYLYPDMDQFSSFNGVCRGIPSVVAGTILSYHYERSSSFFEMEWDEDGSIDAPTRIYFPDIKVMRSGPMSLTSSESGFEWSGLEGTKAGYLSISSSGGGKRSLQIG
jgi:endoglycosylceramidase